MNRGMLLFLAACTLAAAMVPRDRRAVNTEEEEERLMAQSTTSSTTKKTQKICASDTPCAWLIYKPRNYKNIDMNITNTYCKCNEGTVCRFHEDETVVSAYVFRCKPPAEPEDTTDDTTDDS